MAKVARRKPMSEINVVPYIDVMLVLLVIFMVTAPLMTQGIKVELPAADSEAIEVSDPDDFLVVSIDAEGRYFLNIGEKETVMSLEAMALQAAKVVGAQPSIKVLIEGDQAVTYGYVMSAMDRLKNAGIEDVGLVTQPRSSESI
ncbi:MAG: protein TolR [Pseudomonadales bacterium]